MFGNTFAQFPQPVKPPPAPSAPLPSDQYGNTIYPKPAPSAPRYSRAKSGSAFTASGGQIIIPSEGGRIQDAYDPDRLAKEVEAFSAMESLLQTAKETTGKPQDARLARMEIEVLSAAKNLAPADRERLEARQKQLEDRMKVEATLNKVRAQKATRQERLDGIKAFMADPEAMKAREEYAASIRGKTFTNADLGLPPEGVQAEERAIARIEDPAAKAKATNDLADSRVRAEAEAYKRDMDMKRYELDVRQEDRLGRGDGVDGPAQQLKDAGISIFGDRPFVKNPAFKDDPTQEPWAEVKDPRVIRMVGDVIHGRGTTPASGVLVAGGAVAENQAKLAGQAAPPGPPQDPDVVELARSAGVSPEDYAAMLTSIRSQSETDRENGRVFPGSDVAPTPSQPQDRRPLSERLFGYEPAPPAPGIESPAKRRARLQAEEDAKQFEEDELRRGRESRTRAAAR
jgi:hypothetical protein